MAAAELEHDAGAEHGDKAKGDKARQHRLAVIAVVVGIVGAVIAWLSYRKSGSSSAARTSASPMYTGLGQGVVAGAGGGAGDATTGQLSALGQAVEQIRSQLSNAAPAPAWSPAPYDDQNVRSLLQQIIGQQAAVPRQSSPQGSQPGATNVGAPPTQVGLSSVQTVFNPPPVPTSSYSPSPLDYASSQAPVTFTQVPLGANQRGTATIISGAPNSVAQGPIVDTTRGGRLIADEQYVNLGNGRYQVKL